ncbi:MAG TPA: GH1 family beta-glucosidase [Chthoniobacteraceae bacterium]|jgi:beta-glucosidase|nr:GH1 family beta-glucosidase [Chthoniobacteraceae bacterium]
MNIERNVLLPKSGAPGAPGHPGRLSRREFLGAGILGLAACGGIPAGIAAEPLPAINANSPQFPKDFAWGVATAATQIEGAAAEDGKGESIWDRFAAEPGRVVGGDTPAVACDHYHRYPQDIRLMGELGIRNYRMSIAWPRIYPQGDGPVNTKGLDFYDRLIDALLAGGITPFATMFHWDLPQALEDRGGWRVRATPEAFAVYADTIVKKLGDRVRNWMSCNEIPCFIGKGYGKGDHAPGCKEPPKVLNQCYHHALLAHGHAVRAVRQHGAAGARVGLVHNPDTIVPVTETPDDIEAAHRQYGWESGPIMGPVFKGAYPAAWLERAGQAQPEIAPGDMALISMPTDFLGLNIYGGHFCRAGKGSQPESLPLPDDYPRGTLPWLNITPQTMYWGVRHAAEHYGVKNFYISENGVCQDDVVTPKGEVLDIGRLEFYRNYLGCLHRAIHEGFNVQGFFAWSFMDNYEWAEGYAKRFGIVHIDYPTQKRTPKLSAGWYAKVIREGAMV